MTNQYTKAEYTKGNNSSRHV